MLQAFLVDGNSKISYDVFRHTYSYFTLLLCSLSIIKYLFIFSISPFRSHVPSSSPLFYSPTPHSGLFLLFWLLQSLQVVDLHLKIQSQELSLRENNHCLSFCVWVIKLSMIFSRSIHLPAKFMSSIFFTADILWYICSIFSPFIHQLKDTQLVCLLQLL